MKSFTKYFSKYLISFLALIFLLVILNVIAFVGTFYGSITRDYGDSSPRRMLEETVAESSAAGISDTARDKLQSHNIWAMFLSPDGQCIWAVDLPSELPTQYTIQDVAVFSKGYLEDYPVFVWDDTDGLLVLGYPKGSYTKLTSNYYSTDMFQTIPLYFAGILVLDLLLLFGAYYLSKMKIVKETAPLVSSIKALADGKSTSLSVTGELSEVAESVNKASHILSRQNEARANWISGVSHDIRTPLSMIMGYAGKIAADPSVSSSIKEQAEIMWKQSVKIKELVQDLNLVSQLEYEMQPLHKEPVRLSKLIRSYTAELLNAGISDSYRVDIEIAPDAEKAVLECDARLISRAVNNLVQNSIKHNPQGCKIQLILEQTNRSVSLIVADNGIGISAEKLQELEKKPHYMESTDERLDLRHGLGLLIVQQIITAHKGTLKIESMQPHGCKISLIFPVSAENNEL